MKKIIFAIACIVFTQIDASAQSTQQTTPPSNNIGRLRANDVHIDAADYIEREGRSNKRNRRIVVTFDEPTAPYDGEESRANDGVETNKQRNLNYQDNSMRLPPSDGSN